MKHSKKKIRKNNIRRRTKKTNYRQIQRGGMLTPGDKSTISDFMQSLSPDETVLIMFPYDNIHMDIAFPVKSLDQDINNNYNLFRKGATRIDLGTADLDFNDIFDVPNFITNEYDVSQLYLEIPKIVTTNLFDREQGILVPISEPPVGDPIPNIVTYLIKTMKQLARESQGLTIYLDGVIQPKITHVAAPAATAAAPTAAATAAAAPAADINTSIAPCKETSAFYASLLAKIKTNYNISRTPESTAITDKNWDIFFYKILNSFLADDPYLPYFDTFVRQIMNPIEGQDNYPIVSYKQAARDDNEARADMEPLKPDSHINHYDDKIQRFLKLPKITNTGNNLLQYITNKVTVFIYTQNSKIIIQVYTVYYIIIANIQAKGKGNWKSLLLGDKFRASNYYQFVIGCVVLIRTVDIIKGTVEYDYEIRWLLNEHTINNMVKNGMTMKDFFGNNTKDILLEEESTYGIKGPRNTTDYSDPTLPGNRMPVPTLTEPKKTFDGILNDGFSPQSKQSFTALDPGVQMPSISSIKSSLSSASAAAAEGVSKEGEGEEEKEAEWKDLSDEYQTEPGDVDVGGKKNKTRRKSNKKKRSIKRKPKY